MEESKFELIPVELLVAQESTLLHRLKSGSEKLIVYPFFWCVRAIPNRRCVKFVISPRATFKANFRRPFQTEMCLIVPLGEM